MRALPYLKLSIVTTINNDVLSPVRLSTVEQLCVQLSLSDGPPFSYSLPVVPFGRHASISPLSGYPCPGDTVSQSRVYLSPIRLSPSGCSCPRVPLLLSPIRLTRPGVPLLLSPNRLTRPAGPLLCVPYLAIPVQFVHVRQSRVYLSPIRLSPSGSPVSTCPLYGYPLRQSRVYMSPIC